jgi:hypothetical protein
MEEVVPTPHRSRPLRQPVGVSKIGITAGVEELITDSSFSILSSILTSSSRHPRLTITSSPTRFSVTPFRCEQDMASWKNFADGRNLICRLLSKHIDSDATSPNRRFGQFDGDDTSWLSRKRCWSIYSIPTIFTVSELTQNNYSEKKNESPADHELTTATS